MPGASREWRAPSAETPERCAGMDAGKVILASLRAALARNDRDAAREEVRRLIREAPGVRGIAHHLELGAAAEEVGEWRLAETAYRLVLREDPTHPEALARLAELAAERGDLEAAAIQRERLAEARPDDTANLLMLRTLYRELGWGEQRRRVEARLEASGVRLEPEPPPAQAEEDEPGEAPGSGEPDLARVANPSDPEVARFLALFAGREDVHARQWFNPRRGTTGYSPVEEPMTARHVRQHLFGDLTLGVYPIRLDGTCVFFALDLDLTRAAIDHARRGPAEAAAVRETLRKSVDLVVERVRGLGLDPVVEDSGYKGRHLWFFLERPEPASLLHAVGRLLVRHLGEDLPGGIALEFFPRQPRRRGKGLGNLIKLPLGIHRRTGRRAWLLGPDGRPAPDQWGVLAHAPRVGHGALLELADRLAGILGERPDEAAAPWEDAASGSAATSSLSTRPAATETGVAPPQPPPWTEADFQIHPQVSHLLARCAVLAELKRLALETRSLTHDQQIVLVHVLGYVPGGVAAANYLLSRCPTVPADRRLKSPLRGHPISCPKVRQRIPEVTSRVSCSCVFEEAAEAYPSPVLHLRTAPPPGPAPGAEEEPLEVTAQRYLALRDRVDRLEEELASLARVVMEGLRSRGGELALDQGLLRLVVEDGIERLRWEGEG